MSKENSGQLVPFSAGEIVPLVQRAISSVREEMADSPYIEEALRVLPVGGYRSAIGSFWNAVVDDLRNKIMFRSLSLFNKEMNLGREIKTYEDFQNHVNDDQLIDGAYKIGVIGWEACKVLKHAKETRHIFDGHPKSTEPSIIKVLAMMDDCTKYVLQEECPPQIIDIGEYITVMGTSDFDRNAVAIENALGDLPETYKNELANRLFTAYVHPDSTTVLRSNIEFVMPILWAVLPKQVKVQIVRRVDHEIAKGNVACTEQAFAFVAAVKGGRYPSLEESASDVSAELERQRDEVQEKRDRLEQQRKDEERAEEEYDYYTPPPAHDVPQQPAKTFSSTLHCSRTDLLLDKLRGVDPITRLFNDL